MGISEAVEDVQDYGRSEDPVIRVYDPAENVI
jgi:hypothetical protein